MQRCSQVVLHVTLSNAFKPIVFCGKYALKFREDVLLRFLYNVGKTVQAASVWHSDDESACSVVDGLVHEELEAGDERLDAFNTEALHGVVFLGDEAGKGVSVINATV